MDGRGRGVRTFPRPGRVVPRRWFAARSSTSTVARAFAGRSLRTRRTRSPYRSFPTSTFASRTRSAAPWAAASARSSGAGETVKRFRAARSRRRRRAAGAEDERGQDEDEQQDRVLKAEERRELERPREPIEESEQGRRSQERDSGEDGEAGSATRLHRASVEPRALPRRAAHVAGGCRDHVLAGSISVTSWPTGPGTSSPRAIPARDPKGRRTTSPPRPSVPGHRGRRCSRSPACGSP